jgi:hypothetical protein
MSVATDAGKHSFLGLLLLLLGVIVTPGSLLLPLGLCVLVVGTSGGGIVAVPTTTTTTTTSTSSPLFLL